MPKDAKRLEAAKVPAKNTKPAPAETVVKNTATAPSKNKDPEELREQARKLLVEADHLEIQAEKEAARKEAAERALKEKEEREKKEKEELENAQSYTRVFFTHNPDGTIDYDNPFFSANDAKYYDSNYVIVPALVQDGKYIRPLTKEEACLLR